MPLVMIGFDPHKRRIPRWRSARRKKPLGRTRVRACPLQAGSWWPGVRCSGLAIRDTPARRASPASAA
jgi:hypothetical protein